MVPGNESAGVITANINVVTTNMTHGGHAALNRVWQAADPVRSEDAHYTIEPSLIRVLLRE